MEQYSLSTIREKKGVIRERFIKYLENSLRTKMSIAKELDISYSHIINFVAEKGADWPVGPLTLKRIYLFLVKEGFDEKL